MPNMRLSAVLVFHGEQAYVRESILSILGQSFRDVEVVAVDNASPDHAGELLDELAAADERLRVLHFAKAVSPGEAHDAALAEASGDYVWFLQPTDRLLRGALAAVAECLDTSDLDVLVVDHARETPLVRSEEGVHAAALESVTTTGSFSLADYPAVAEVGVEPGSVILRRAFLARRGTRFAAGAHGHLAVTYRALVASTRIGALPRLCFAHLERPRLRPAPAVYGSPFDVFARYDDVFSVASAGGTLSPALRASLARAMLRHCVSLLAEVPPARRPEFFARLAASWRRHAVPAARPESRRLRLAARGRYRAYRAVVAADARLRRLRRRGAQLWRVLRRAAAFGRRAPLRAYYLVQRRRPLDPKLAVFAAYWYRGYACNPRAIYEKLRELVPEIRAIWVVDPEYAAGMPPNVECVVAGTRAYYRVVARAKYFVNNVGFPDEVVERPDAVRVHTHHGTPLKTMGLDLRSAFYAGPRMDFERQVRRLGRWDYSVSQNAFTSVIWERVYPGRYETLEVGYPRNDVLANAGPERVAAVRRELGIGTDRVAVLYAPTRREYLRADVPPLDVERLAGDLGRDYVILVRAHYLQGSDAFGEGVEWSGAVRDVTAHQSIEDLFLAADVLITDYSSVMFDYAVLDRPIVIYAPDWDVYRTLRGTYFDLLAEPPGVVAATYQELTAAFRSGAVSGEEAARLRATFRDRFCYLDDGRAAERVVRRVWLGEGVLSAEVPAADERSARPRLVGTATHQGDG